MFDWLSLTLLAALTAALLLGGMVFFALIFAPLTFRHLPREIAGGFLREVFPVYYLFGLVLAGLAGGFALTERPTEGAILLLVAAGFGGLRWGLLPRINDAREGKLAGVPGMAERFARLHRVSAVANLLQMLAVALVLTGLTLAA